MAAWRWLVAGLLLAGLPTADVDADVIRFRHGGELRGELRDSAASADPSPYTIVTLIGTRVVVARDQALSVTRRSMLVEEYVTRARQTPDTVDAHWELAEWCRVNLLTEQRQEQLELLLEIDPDHAEARRILGHVLENGRWMTRDEMMTSRGYVKHKGRWITRQELDLLEKTQAQREAEVAWYPKIRLWFTWLSSNDARRREAALKELSGVDSPDAIPALTNFMAADANEQIRQVYVTVLGRIGGRAAAVALIDRYLYDGSGSIRQQSYALVPPDEYVAVIPFLVKALRDDANPVVRRAGSALGDIGEPGAVPALIDALVTTHKYKVPVRSNKGTSFGYTPGGQVGMLPAGSASNVIPPEIEMLARTGQLPYGVDVVTPPTSRVTRYVTVRVEVHNDEVLSALRSITGKDFGYNQQDWKLWWALNKS